MKNLNELLDKYETTLELIRGIENYAGVACFDEKIKSALSNEEEISKLIKKIEQNLKEYKNRSKLVKAQPKEPKNPFEVDELKLEGAGNFFRSKKTESSAYLAILYFVVDRKKEGFSVLAGIEKHIGFKEFEDGSRLAYEAKGMIRKNHKTTVEANLPLAVAYALSGKKDNAMKIIKGIKNKN